MIFFNSSLNSMLITEIELKCTLVLNLKQMYVLSSLIVYNIVKQHIVHSKGIPDRRMYSGTSLNRT